MKALLTIGLFMLLYGSLHAQTPADSLKAYIKTEGYVPITNKSKLPKALMPYYKSIMDSLACHFNGYEKYYMQISTFDDYGKGIAFKIYLLEDIAFLKERHKVDSLTKIENEKLQTDSSKFLKLDDGTFAKIQIVDDYGGDAGISITFSKVDHTVRWFSFQ